MTYDLFDHLSLIQSFDSLSHEQIWQYQIWNIKEKLGLALVKMPTLTSKKLTQ